jgi:ssDNA-binding Zn-finger/Zn-ribbon topoisomerase 1
MAEKSNKRKVVCPECDQADVEIVRDDEGDDNGVCVNCGLNVGRVLTKNRYDKALAKVRTGEEEESKKVAKKKDKGGFWS